MIITHTCSIRTLCKMNIIKRYYSINEVSINTGLTRQTILIIIDIFKIQLIKVGSKLSIDARDYDTILDLIALKAKSGMRYDFIKKLSKTQISELLEL